MNKNMNKSPNKPNFHFGMAILIYNFSDIVILQTCWMDEIVSS